MKNSKRKYTLKRSNNTRYSTKTTNDCRFSGHYSSSEVLNSLNQNKHYFLDLLLSLDGVLQSPQYHPESDALFHSLQVFQFAYQESDDPELWLAALLHDVGKSVDSKEHAEIGAEMVAGLLPHRVSWLIAHHLDLMLSPRKTQQKLAHSQQLSDLKKLRAWDIAGRCPDADVCSPEQAIDLIISSLAR